MGKAISCALLEVPLYVGLFNELCQVPQSHRLKAIFSDEWGYELDSLPSAGEKAASQSIKLFVVLNQSNLNPKFCDLTVPQNKTVCFFLQTLALLVCLLVQVPLIYTASRSCYHPFWSNEAGDTFHSGWDCITVSLPGREVDRYF